MSSKKKHNITKNNGRKAATPKRIFSKKVEIMITGTNVDEITKTASELYAYQNDYTAGGRDERTVQLRRTDSTEVETIFFGKV